MDLEKPYYRVNMGELWQVLRMYGLGGKLLNIIKSKQINILACIRMKGGESECLRINSCVKQGRIMSPCVFNVYMSAIIKNVKMGMKRRKGNFQEEGRR